MKNIKPHGNSKRIGFIPHHVSDRFADYEKICNEAGVEHISARGLNNVEKFIGRVKSCDYIVTEALHGAILADLFRKPWMPVVSRDYIYEFKWDDWCQSIGVPYEPHRIDGLMTRGLKPHIRLLNVFKRGFSYIGIRHKKWSHKPFLYDNKDKELLVAEQLRQIVNSDKWILSSDATLERLVARSGEILSDFKKQIGA